ncbi:unnamed protein product, partial [Brenthis ino]
MHSVVKYNKKWIGLRRDGLMAAGGCGALLRGAGDQLRGAAVVDPSSDFTTHIPTYRVQALEYSRNALHCTTLYSTRAKILVKKVFRINFYKSAIDIFTVHTVVLGGCRLGGVGRRRAASGGVGRGDELTTRVIKLVRIKEESKRVCLIGHFVTSVPLPARAPSTMHAQSAECPYTHIALCSHRTAKDSDNKMGKYKTKQSHKETLIQGQWEAFARYKLLVDVLTKIIATMLGGGRRAAGGGRLAHCPSVGNSPFSKSITFATCCTLSRRAARPLPPACGRPPTRLLSVITHDIYSRQNWFKFYV